MNNVIYFNKDCEVHAKEYAEDARAQEIANKISGGIEKLAVGMCVVVSILAVAIMVSLLII